MSGGSPAGGAGPIAAWQGLAGAYAEIEALIRSGDDAGLVERMQELARRCAVLPPATELAGAEAIACHAAAREAETARAAACAALKDLMSARQEQAAGSERLRKQARGYAAEPPSGSRFLDAQR